MILYAATVKKTRVAVCDCTSPLKDEFGIVTTDFRIDIAVVLANVSLKRMCGR